MKSTGVVRRVDDLGRIVIPKEIRRNLKIRDGEEIEIYIDDGSVILKKHSVINDINDVSKKMIDIVSSLLGKTILVSDRDSFIVGSGDLKKIYIGKSISAFVNSIILERKHFVEKSVSPVYLTEKVEDNYSYSIYPIICHGDVLGSVVLLSNSSDISDFDVNMISLIAQFLGKYIED